MNVAVAILAGGKSSRMHEPKSGVRLASGKTMFEHVYANVSELGLPIIVVGHADGIARDQFSNLRVVPDGMPERGPVGGLLGLFQSKIAENYLVVACDQPLLTSNLLKKLLARIEDQPRAFCTSADSTIHPLPALFPAALLTKVEQLLTSPRASLRELLTISNVQLIELALDEIQQFRSANTREQVAEINQLLDNPEYKQL